MKPTEHDLKQLVVISKLKSWFFTVLGFFNALVIMSTVFAGTYGSWWIVIPGVMAIYSAWVVSKAEMIVMGAMEMIEKGEYTDEGG